MSRRTRSLTITDPAVGVTLRVTYAGPLNGWTVHQVERGRRLRSESRRAWFFTVQDLLAWLQHCALTHATVTLADLMPLMRAWRDDR